jgi:xanthine dehydrogenase molybdopterin-binding subunit B
MVFLNDEQSNSDFISGKEFANVLFRKDQVLQHGKRYRFCVYAPKTSVSYEKWIEVLEETYACSDGITVDLTPPIPGRVWIGIDPSEHYQVHFLYKILS